MKLLGQGFYWDDLAVGDTARTYGRTINEGEAMSYLALTGLLGPQFVDREYQARQSQSPRRLVPAALVYGMAEGLVLSVTAYGTGVALLHVEIDIKGATEIGDTIHVETEVTEIRPTSKGRALVRTSNRIVNQRDETVIIYDSLRLILGKPEEGEK